MTVPTEVSLIQYVGNGATVDFPVPFPFFEDEDLVVTKVLTSTGVKTVQALGTDYGVTGAGDPTGVVVMAAAPSNLYTLSIERTVPVVQEQAFSTQGPFSPAAHEAEFDYVIQVCQQLVRRLAALEALGNLVVLTTFAAQLKTLVFTTDVVAVENTFAAGALHTAVAVPLGKTISGVLVAKVAIGGDGDASQDAVMVRDFSWDGATLTFNFITGLDVNKTYTLTLLLLTMDA